MRRVIVMLVLLVCVGANAQQTQTVSFFMSDLMQTETDRRTGQWPSGFGVSYERMFGPRWSAQAAVAVEHHESYPYLVEDDGSITFVDRVRLQTVPLDLTARYHWPNDTRWKPFLGFGAHYVAAPSADRRFRYQSRFGGEVTGGTLFMFTPSFGAMVDGRVFIATHESYEPPLRVSFGASWRF